MKTKPIITTVLCGFLIILVLDLNCNKTENDKVPITTSSKEALKFYTDGIDQLDQIQIEKARALFEKAIQLDSTFAMAYYQLAMTSNETQKFLNYFSKALSCAERVSQGEMLRIQSNWELITGNSLKGAELTRNLIALYPRDKDAHLALAGYYNRLQQYEKSAEEYHKVVIIDPLYAVGYNAMAYGYMAAGKIDDAEKAIQKYIELRPAEPNPYDSQGEILRKAGKFEESTASYHKALLMDSAFIMSQRGIGINLAIIGKTKESIKELETAVRKAPNDGEKQAAFSNMAFAWILAGDYPKAIEAVTRSLAISEKNKDEIAQSSDLSSIAWILLEQNQFQKYREYNDRARKLVEGSHVSEGLRKTLLQQFLFNESDLAHRQNQFKISREKAEEYHNAIMVKNDPSDVMQYQDLIGSLALAEKRYDDAIKELEKANQRNCYIMYRMGEAYAAKGEKEKAKELFLKVVNYNEYNWTFAFLRDKAQKKLENL